MVKAPCRWLSGIRVGMAKRLQLERSAADFVPLKKTLPNLQVASKKCEGCDLYKLGTQTVFGDGAAHARVMFVGEQPGDKEDLAGKPFVGPAGALLDKALVEAGIDRKQVYVTNAVKHFKWEPRGKRRIHKKPNSLEIAACRPWLDSEIEVVRPDVVVCLGATAAQALLGRTFKVTQRRGEVIEQDGQRFVATVHPSSILRAPDEETRHEEMKRFIEDLKVVGEVMERGSKAA
jgi:uracil-DNA glycosylase